ncbi:MAG: P1 family peptidase, partial [Cytophagales bacterium]|nr:P1 family peptidase [Cytophagales bacterium]
RRSLLKRSGLGNYKVLSNARQSPLYQAVAEATEEAIYNSLFKARTLGGKDGHRLPALPAAAVADLLKRRGG